MNILTQIDELKKLDKATLAIDQILMDDLYEAIQNAMAERNSFALEMHLKSAKRIERLGRQREILLCELEYLEQRF